MTKQELREENEALKAELDAVKGKVGDMAENENMANWGTEMILDAFERKYRTWYRVAKFSIVINIIIILFLVIK